MEQDFSFKNKRLYAWQMLFYEGRPIVGDIFNKWNNLLNARTSTAQDYVNFISKHSSWFFHSNHSPISLGQNVITITNVDFSKTEADFVVARDYYSTGTQYTFVKILRPNSEIYALSGGMSSEVSEAIEQLIEIHTLMNQPDNPVHRSFPPSNTIFNYRIYVGQTSSDERESVIKPKDQTIVLGSFDELTGAFQKRQLTGFAHILAGRITDSKAEELNQLVNPFLEAIEYDSWKRVGGIAMNLFSSHSNKILRMSKHNEFMAQFTKIWNKLPANDKSAYLRELQREFYSIYSV